MIPDSLPSESTNEINFYNEDLDFTHPSENLIFTCLNQIITDHKRSLGEISIVFCSDEHLLDMNRQYLNHDYYTDIITFPMQDSPLSGDLFISVNRVRDNADKNGDSFLTELNRVIIHGVLHLVGYNDKTESEIAEMRKKENLYLSLVGG